MENMVERNTIKYNVYMDPDVEFLDSDGKFPSEYKEEVSNGKIILILILSILLIVLVAIWRKENTKTVELTPKTSTVKVVEVSEIVKTSQTSSGAFTRVQEGIAAQKGVEIKPYFIDGYDYAQYNSGKCSLTKVMNEIGYDDPKLLVSTFYNGIIDVIGSKNLYTMHKENGNYIYFLYLPKVEEEVSVNEEYTNLNTIISYEDGREVRTYAITFLHGKDIVGENLPIKVHITYKDGTEEDLEVFVTKNYT